MKYSANKVHIQLIGVAFSKLTVHFAPLHCSYPVPDRDVQCLNLKFEANFFDFLLSILVLRVIFLDLQSKIHVRFFLHQTLDILYYERNIPLISVHQYVYFH